MKRFVPGMSGVVKHLVVDLLPEGSGGVLVVCARCRAVWDEGITTLPECNLVGAR